MFKEKAIRPIAISVLRRGNKILVEKGYDSKKDETFYRPLGGGIEFGEKVEDALKREYMEEIGAEIIVGKRLDVNENIFTYNGNDGHELVFIHEAEFVDKTLYEQETFPFVEQRRPGVYAEWVEITDDVIIYPSVVKKFK